MIADIGHVRLYEGRKDGTEMCASHRQRRGLCFVGSWHRCRLSVAVKPCPERAQHLWQWENSQNEDFQPKYGGNISLAFVTTEFRGGVEFMRCPWDVCTGEGRKTSHYHHFYRMFLNSAQAKSSLSSLRKR